MNKQRPFLSHEPSAQKPSDFEEAFARLAVTYGPLIRRLAARLQTAETDREDLEQEGLLGLLDAARTFRETGGASFETYVYTCVRNRMLSVLRRAHGGMFLSLDDEELNDGERCLAQSVADPEQLVVAQDDEAELDKRLRSLLTPLEYEVLRLHMDGYSYREMARQLQVSEKAVDNALQRIRRKLST